MTKEKIDELNITNKEKKPNINDKEKRMQELNIKSNVIKNLKINIEKLKQEKSYNLLWANMSLVFAASTGAITIFSNFCNEPIIMEGTIPLTAVLTATAAWSYKNAYFTNNQIKSLEKETKSLEEPAPALKKVRK